MIVGSGDEIGKGQGKLCFFPESVQLRFSAFDEMWGLYVLKNCFYLLD